jgi:indolepyruvate ferredoxin oxidoreductase, beta subunit
MSGVTTVCLVGVGGQGILLAASILSEAASADDLMVKASEIHGMAQRGGSVVSTVRFGAKVYSPVSKHADIVLATELLEGHRGLRLLGEGGTLVCAVSTVIPPSSVLRREEQYPEDLAAEAAARGIRLLAVDAEALAREAGTIKAVNVALLGAASVVFPFVQASWETAIERAVPAKIRGVNQRAFALGREAVAGEVTSA